MIQHFNMVKSTFLCGKELMLNHEDIGGSRKFEFISINRMIWVQN